MKISSSNMIMQSSRRYTSSWSVTQRFQFNKGLQDAGTKETKEWEEPEASQTYDSLKNYFGNLRITHLEVRQDTGSVFEQFRQQTIRSIFAMLFGEEKAKEIFEDREISAKQTEVPAQTLQTGTLQSAGRITYRVEQQYAEQESTYFSTNGIVRTADGRELFGPGSGNGFEELAAYDEDGNGWIDENDVIFNSLKIWCKDENGNDRLYSLAEKGVGAICLQNVSTDFSLKNAKNETNGIIRNTGIFLYENGAAGTIQHVDMAKHLDKTQ